MKKLLVSLLLLTSIPVLASDQKELQCFHNGKEIDQAREYYTCWEEEHQVKYDSIEEIFQMIEREYPGEDLGMAFRWACRYIDRHQEFEVINDSGEKFKFQSTYKIMVNPSRPNDNFTHIQIVDLRNETNGEIDTHSVYSDINRPHTTLNIGSIFDEYVECTTRQ